MPARQLFFVAFLLVSFVLQFGGAANAQTVRVSTNIGDIVIRMFPNDAPISVDNFLGYVNRGDYDGTIIHRSVSNFVVQGGSFLTTGAPINTQASIQNEFGRSNLRGTVAFARVGGQVNSATSSFFINVDDSNNFLDNVDEGFTVFGEVVSGMDVVDAMNGLQIVNAGGAFAELPVLDTFDNQTLFVEDLVVLNSVTVEPPLLGDVNLDSAVDFTDIGPFISVLSSGLFQDEADIDRNGAVDFLDIAGFIAILAQP